MSPLSAFFQEKIFFLWEKEIPSQHLCQIYRKYHISIYFIEDLGFEYLRKPLALLLSSNTVVAIYILNLYI